MNATEMGRRSDSLYYDNVSRRELCDRVAHLESDLEDAKGTFDERERMFRANVEKNCDLMRLMDENAKLRELVQYICDECYGDDWFIEEAAALGIEGRY